MKFSKSEPPPINEAAITGPRTLRDPHSREYAVQTMRSLKRFLEGKTIEAKGVERELERIRTYKHWEVCGHKNLNAYLKAELGYGTRQLRARLAQDLAADPNVPPARDEKGGRPRNDENMAISHVSSDTLSSDSALRIVRRLKRDHKEIAAALARGEFPSARAAGIAAGFVKEPTALDKIRKLLPKLTVEERIILANELQDFNFGADIIYREGVA
jgi:hypothetical protein